MINQEREKLNPKIKGVPTEGSRHELILYLNGSHGALRLVQPQVLSFVTGLRNGEIGDSCKISICALQEAVIDGPHFNEDRLVEELRNDNSRSDLHASSARKATFRLGGAEGINCTVAVVNSRLITAYESFSIIYDHPRE